LQTSTADSDQAEELGDASSASERGRRRYSLLTDKDRRVLAAMVGIPTFLHVMLIWVPAILSVALSFASWNGFKISRISWNGLTNYKQIFTVFEKDFYEAVLNNLWVLVFLFFFATPMGMFVAYLLDKNLKGTTIYQSLLYFPVVLSLAVVGFIWKSVIYSPRQGVLNTLLGRTDPGNQIDWLGNSDFVIGLTDNYGLSKNFLALIAPMMWQHVGYIMVLYLAGLKSVDPSLREAAAIDGAGEWQSFRRIIAPSLRPVNVVIMVITVITGLRVYDIIDVLNNPIGTNVLSLLVTESTSGESSNVGRGSAYAAILLALCFGFVIWYLRSTFKEDDA
jgi:multiple sugar transport system permease protein